ncbi:nucleolar protein 4 [Angomonas deanei]|nr:nucleolar protein 4 [Angomonas deanei]|eukprot:EPY34985.1 nucleolar protein 4 [Angomonas deanei]
MGKSVVRRKPTPSALRKKKAQQRVRKQIKRKVEKRRPNVKQALSKSYSKHKNEPFLPHHKAKKLLAKEEGAATSQRRKKGSGEEEEGGFSFRKPEEFDDDAEVQSDVDEEKETRLNARDPLETQLFLKYLPLDTSEEELLSLFQTLFPQYKPGVRRVLLVRNKATRQLSGTGFVHCGSVELAEAIYERAQKNAREVAATQREEMKKETEGLSHHKAKKLEYKMRTDAFVARDPFLTVRDTKFTVLKVLSRTDTQEAVASQVKKNKRTKVAGDDPRNLYLLQEGLILPDSPAAKGLHPRYMQMIQNDYEERKAQLKNTLYFVSKTRLSVRNLPRTMTENDLRRLFAEKAREYLETHKKDMEREKWGKYGPIKNVKLLKDNVGVSKGYGFVEFVNHNVALYALRHLNNNPTIFGDHRRLMVSFSLENTNAVQKLQRIKGDEATEEVA